MLTAEETVAREVAAIKEHMTASIAPMREELDRMKASLTQALALQREARRAELSRNSAGRPRIASGRYEGRDALDVAIIRALSGAMRANPRGLQQSAVANLEGWNNRITAATRTLQTAALDSTTADAGDELVDTQEARVLWDDVNLETAIAPLFPAVAMPSNPFTIPLQFGDVNWYPGTANIAGTGSTPDTGKQTLTAYELYAHVPWSLDLDEDAVVSMMDEVRSSILRNAREVIDDILLNADTTVLNGINSDGATIAATDAGKAQWLLGFDGLRHQGIIDNTSNLVDHSSAAPTDAMFNANRLKLGKYGVRPSECVHVVDIATWIKSQTISNLRTIDVFGPHATLLNGQLGAIEGIPVIVSELMRKTASDGKVTDATPVAEGTLGQLLTFNRTQWRVGFRRDIKIEAERDIQKRQTIMVLTFRLAFMERSGARSSATHTAVTHSILVT